MFSELKPIAQFQAELDDLLQQARNARLASNMGELQCMYDLAVLCLKMDHAYTSEGWSA